MILREAFDYEFSRLDPTGPHIDPCHLAVYELLMVKGPDWAPHPRLAESWDVSEDGLRWRIRLRPDARFHSGARCDAQAVLGPLEHLRYEFPTGQLWYWDPVDSVEAEDDRTLVFSLHYPYARLPSLLWGTHTTIYNEALRAAEPDRFGFAVADGTGPFRLVSWAPDRVVAERFDDYGGAAPKLDGIEWLAILEPADRLAALERGEVDVVHGPPMEDVDAAPRGRALRRRRAPAALERLPRPRLPPQRARIRRPARAGGDLARDRPGGDRPGGLRGPCRPTWGPVPPGDEFYDQDVDRGRSRDVGAPPSCCETCAAASRSAASASCRTTPSSARWAGSSRSSWRRSASTWSSGSSKPFAPFYEACTAGPAAFINKWLWPDALDAVIGFASTGCEGFPNWQHASIPALDAAFDEWLRAGTREELSAAASRAQRIAASGAPVRTARHARATSGYTRQRLRGFEPHPADLYPLYDRAHFVLMLAARLHAGETRLRLEEVPTPEPDRRPGARPRRRGGRLPVRPPCSRRRLRGARLAAR